MLTRIPEVVVDAVGEGEPTQAPQVPNLPPMPVPMDSSLPSEARRCLAGA
jgi:hypothetical protein